MAGMPEPPTRAATECAVEELVQLGALSEDELLTNLGRRIAKFSTSPVLSKALVYGVILRYGLLKAFKKIFYFCWQMFKSCFEHHFHFISGC